MKRKFIVTIAAQMALVIAVLASMVGCGTSVHSIMSLSNVDEIYDHAINFYEEEEWKKASTIFDNINSYYSGSVREDTIRFYSARCRFKQGSYELARELFDDFRRKFGRSVFIEDAEGMYALSYYYLAPGETRDQKQTSVAISVINEFLSRYPMSQQKENFVKMRAELTLRLHKKEFLNAYTYYKIGKYKSAIIAFKNAMRAYPDSELREKISFYVVASAYELANNSIESLKEDRYLSMIDSYYTFIAEFPDSEYRHDVDVMERKARAYLDKCAKAREKAEAGETEADDDEVESLSERRERRKAEKEEAKAEKEARDARIAIEDEEYNIYK